MSDWISVEERLPKQLTPVLLAMGDVVTEAELCDGIWHTWAYSEAEATHWMPLPSPPTDSEEK